MYLGWSPQQRLRKGRWSACPAIIRLLGGTTGLCLRVTQKRLGPPAPSLPLPWLGRPLAGTESPVRAGAGCRLLWGVEPEPCVGRQETRAQM